LKKDFAVRGGSSGNKAKGRGGRGEWTIGGQWRDTPPGSNRESGKKKK